MACHLSDNGYKATCEFRAGSSGKLPVVFSRQSLHREIRGARRDRAPREERWSVIFFYLSGLGGPWAYTPWASLLRVSLAGMIRPPMNGSLICWPTSAVVKKSASRQCGSSLGKGKPYHGNLTPIDTRN